MSKNLIILCSDQLRADSLGFMGNPVCRTPHFDRLAARSVVFNQCFTTFPKCVPARAALMTGRYAHTDGWRTVQQVLAPEQPNLLRTLRETGYQTCVFGKNHCWHASDWDALTYTSEHPALVRHLEGRRAQVPLRFKTSGRVPLQLDEGWDYIGNGTRHRPDEAFTDQAVEFLGERRDPARPFFLQLNWESPHSVYGVEDPWFSMYDRDALPELPIDPPANAPLAVRAQRQFRTGMERNPAACREVLATYYGMVSKLDHLCGRLLDTLDRLDLWRDTVVLFLSDHGDYAGQYGLVEKYDTHFPDCLMRTPCVLGAPGLEGGRRVSSLADFSGLAPTLIELLGLPALPHMHGESLLPVIEGRRRIEAVFADGGHEVEMRRRYLEINRERIASGTPRFGKGVAYWSAPDSMARAQMVRTERHKLVVRETGDNEFYDLVADPWEMHNLWGDPAILPALPDLYQRLLEWNLRTLPEKPRLDWYTV